ncbi:MarR family winged helix-turn-helix transcriptional regulator [Microbacterium resistens]|uniref:MarR family winged helix-turn-helix transcriptional regulator n=1 Tax=Microbacterium resistens TaxID=156977 RepID=UPI000AD45E67|nr:MarR family winged helix-turn-helix transcriptional regulator [Microbacterium resistens]
MSTPQRPSDGEVPDPVDAIFAFLGRLRGRGPFGPGDPRMRGGPHARGHRHGVPAPSDGDREGVGLHGGHGHGGHRGHRGAGMPGGRGGHGMDGRAPARLRMLEALAGGALSVSAIGEAIGVDQPRASRLVQQGVDSGWVVREADPEDARRTRIVLTDEGRRLIRGVRGERREVLGRALEALEPEERTELARLLTKLAENWR